MMRRTAGVEVKLSPSLSAFLSSRFLSPAAGPLRAERRQSVGFWCWLSVSEAALAALDAACSSRLVWPLVSPHISAKLVPSGWMTSFHGCIRLLFLPFFQGKWAGKSCGSLRQDGTSLCPSCLS